MYKGPATRHCTLAWLAYTLWPARHCLNPHSVRAVNTSCGVRRGFLHRGLCDTYPQVVAPRRCVLRAGQVSHNPKQELSMATDSFVALRHGKV